MKIRSSPALPLLLASAVLSGHLEKFIIAVAAASIHEAGHLLAAKILRIKIKCIRFGILGASIEAYSVSMSYKDEAVLCLCGPLANILSSVIIFLCLEPKSEIINFFIVSSLMLAFLNLLPAKGFDGGRIFLCVLQFFLPFAVSRKILEVSSFLCVFTLWSISVYFILRTGSYLSLFVFSGALFFKMFLCEEKINIT